MAALSLPEDVALGSCLPLLRLSFLLCERDPTLRVV